MIVAFTTALALQTMSYKPPPALSFSVRQLLVELSVEVVADRFRGADGKIEYWFRKTVRERSTELVTWTDTRHCPAARAALESLATIEPPPVSVPGYGPRAPASSVQDGAAYALEAATGAPYSDGRVTITSNVGTPLARWIDTTLAATEACWSPMAPSEAGPG